MARTKPLGNAIANALLQRLAPAIPLIAGRLTNAPWSGNPIDCDSVIAKGGTGL